jgi:two-component system, OmpR family, response regulator
MRILLVEDEPRIGADVATTLQADGYVVEMAPDGEDAWFRGDTEDFDLIVLDLGLPGMDGLAILKLWRAAGRHVPVLVLTARGAWAQRVEGIDAGADDYLAKPFRMEELLARVRALIRRSAGHSAPVISTGVITLDTLHMRVTVNGVPAPLSPLEYRLAAYLIHHQSRVVPAGELIEHVYGDSDAREANALEAVVTRVRKKLGAQSIKTRRGFGYTMMEEPPEYGPSA